MKLEETIAGITKIRTAIHLQNLWNDPLKLSDAMLKLSVYNSYLSDNIAKLHKIATDEAFKQFKEHESMGATKAQQYAKGLSTTERYNFENAKILYGSVENLLSQLQSRLRVIENALRSKI